MVGSDADGMTALFATIHQFLDSLAGSKMDYFKFSDIYSSMVSDYLGQIW